MSVSKEELQAAFAAGKLPKASLWWELIDKLYANFEGVEDINNKHSDVVEYHRIVNELYQAVIQSEGNVDESELAASGFASTAKDEADRAARQKGIVEQAGNDQVQRVQTEGASQLALVTEQAEIATSGATAAGESETETRKLKEQTETIKSETSEIKDSAVLAADRAEAAIPDQNGSSGKALFTVNGKTVWNGISNPNLLINGDFSVNQRGITSTTSREFLSDRWSFYVSANTTITSSVAYSDLGSRVLSWSWLRTGSVTSKSVSQLIEDVSKAVGEVTVSFDIARLDGSDDVVVYLVQNFGSGGSPQVNTGRYTIEGLTSTLQRKSFTFSLPSIEGKTIGAGSNIGIFIQSTGQVASIIRLAGMKLELGSVATPFIPDDHTTNLAKCQRYFLMPDTPGYIAIATEYSAGNFWSTLAFPTTMRVKPTVTAVYERDPIQVHIGTSGIALKFDARSAMKTGASFDAELIH